MRRALLSLLAEQTNQTLWRQHFITSATPPPFHHEPTLRNRDTYYFIAITAYQMDFSRVTPSEIVFKQELASSESSVIFLVEVRNQVCVMKVVCRLYSYKAWKISIHTHYSVNSITMMGRLSLRPWTVKQTSTFANQLPIND